MTQNTATRLDRLEHRFGLDQSFCPGLDRAGKAAVAALVLDLADVQQSGNAVNDIRTAARLISSNAQVRARVRAKVEAALARHQSLEASNAEAES